jgi:CheY-like chemotaxis protein
MSEKSKVLIADDEQASIDFVVESLAELDCEVLSACDGEAALALAREQLPQVIILDVQMPKLTGFDVFSRLRADEKLSSVPVIMLTGIGERTGFKFDKEEMGQYTGSEPEAYLDKPIEPVVLRQTVGRLLKKART